MSSTPSKFPRVSLDVWAVALSLALALLVRLGVIQHVAW